MRCFVDDTRSGDVSEDKRWDAYLTRMSKEGEWGDMITLLAAAEHFHITIVIISDTPATDEKAYTIVISPQLSKSLPGYLCLAHLQENHYHSLI